MGGGPMLGLGNPVWFLTTPGKLSKAGLNISGLGGLDKAYQDHSKGSLEDVWKLSRPLKWS